MKPNLPLPHKTPKFGLIQNKDYDDHIEKINLEKEKLEKSLKNSKENKFSIAKSFSKEKNLGLIQKKKDDYKNVLEPNNQKENFFIKQRSKDSLTEFQPLESKDRDYDQDFYNLIENQENKNPKNEFIKTQDDLKEKDSKPKISDKIKFINDLFDNIQNNKEQPAENNSSPETSFDKPEISVVKPALPVKKPENPIKFIYKPKNHITSHNYMGQELEEETNHKKIEKKFPMEKSEKNDDFSLNKEGKLKFSKERSPHGRVDRTLSSRIRSEIQNKAEGKNNEEIGTILSNDSKKSPIKSSYIHHHKSTKSTNLDSVSNISSINKPKSPLKKLIVKNLIEANRSKNGPDNKIYKAYEKVLKSFEKDVEWNKEQNRKNKSPLKNMNFENLVAKKNKNSVLKRVEKSSVSVIRGRNERGRNEEIPNVKRFYEGIIHEL